MSRLLDVFRELLLSFGYQVQTDLVAEGVSGRRFEVPLLAERDGRRTAIFHWISSEPLEPDLLRAAGDCVKESGYDAGIFLSLGPVNETLAARALKDSVWLWDAKRVVQELGEAVLAETCPDVWTRSDPLLPPRPSKVLQNVLQKAAAAEAPRPALPLPPPAPAEPAQEPAFAAPVPPVLAGPKDQAPAALELPAAFGLLDLAAPPPKDERKGIPTPTPVAAPTPTVPPPRVAPSATARPQRAILRTQVSKMLALSLVKSKLRSVDKIFLRLSPFHVYDYEANLLIDGSLDADVKRGRIAVDASTKRVVDWTTPLETGEIMAEGADVDEKKVRIADAEAQAMCKEELVKLVTRDVVMEEDSDEWAVVVKKKVTLGPDDVKLHPQGLFHLPLWRITSREGSIEIDATSGNVLFEEILGSSSDAQLI